MARLWKFYDGEQKQYQSSRGAGVEGLLAGRCKRLRGHAAFRIPASRTDREQARSYRVRAGLVCVA